MTRRDLSLVIAWITASPLLRGLDYILPPTTVGILERSAPLELWAGLLWAASALLIYGAWTRRHLLVWLGHGMHGILYAVLALSVIIDSSLKLDGWRGAGPVGLISLLHWIFCIRTGPRPIAEPQATDAVAVEGGGNA